MKGRLFKIFLLFTSILIALIITELLVKKLKPQLTFINAETLTFDCFAPDPILPYTLGRNYKCRMKYYLGDFNTYATLNSHGYRGKEFNLSKDPQVTRILVLGDSITFGNGVSDENTYPFLLQKILNAADSNIEVINAGYADGFSPDSYYLYLKDRGFDLDPDIVILGFFVMNDIQDLAETIWEKVDAQGFPEKIVSCCNIVDWRIIRNKNIDIKYRYPILRDSHLYILSIDTLQKRFDLLRPPALVWSKGEKYRHCPINPECMPLFEKEEKKAYKIISRIKELTDKKGIKFLVALFPGDIQLYSNVGGKYGFTYYPLENNKDYLQKRIAKFFINNNISYLDLYPVFDSQRNRGYPYFVNDAHFNNLGNQIIAETIADYIENNIFYK